MRNPGALAGATGAYEAGGSHGTPYRREGDMSKIDTKGLGRAARRLAKAGKLPPGVAALKPIPKREAQPRDREGRFSRPPVDPRRETLDSRCRRFGLTPNDDNREIVGSSWMGCDLGFVVCLTNQSRGIHKPFLAYGVVGVFFGSTSAEMARIHATWVIASMKDIQTLTDFTVG